MIKEHCFTKEWITGFRKDKKYSKINPPVLEKMINAFYLLELLLKEDFNFIFKGGTSLILLLENTTRFSVDVDVLTEQSQKEIEDIFDEVIKKSRFVKWELDERRSYKSGIPKAHYEFKFNLVFSSQPNSIMLDVLFEKSKYPKLQTLPIKAIWIEDDEDITVTLPTVESITGDKLTAFAPNTTGILYGSGKELEIIKQLFDLGKLFDKIEDIEIVNKSFQIFAEQEIGYRKLSITADDILNDIFNTAKLISLREKIKTELDKERFKEIQKGIRSFSSFLMTGSFHIDDAIVASSKAAYLAMKLKYKDFSPLEKYRHQDLSKVLIDEPEWNYLNKLKKLPDKSAFFYWYKVLKIIHG